MMQSFEDAGKVGKEVMDTGLKSFVAVSKGAQAISLEASEYSKKSFEQTSAAMEQVFGAKSFDKAMELQADYAKQAYEGMVAQATRMSELYSQMARDAYKPFESLTAQSK